MVPTVSKFCSAPGGKREGWMRAEPQELEGARTAMSERLFWGHHMS